MIGGNFNLDRQNRFHASALIEPFFSSQKRPIVVSLKYNEIGRFRQIDQKITADRSATGPVAQNVPLAIGQQLQAKDGKDDLL